MKRVSKHKKYAFTLLEMIFAIVIIGILSKFGVDLFAQSYNNYIFTKINNRLQNQSGTAVEFVAKRLSYRIPNSVIARVSGNDFDGVQDLNDSKDYRVLEWIATDIDGWRGNTQPYWSGIADLDDSNFSNIATPNTDVSEIDNFIKWLSEDDSDYSTIADAAIYFIDGHNDIQNGYGWNTSAGFTATLTDRSIHPLTSVSDDNLFGNFTNVTLSEYYKLSWTANAVAIENDNKGNNTYNLVFYFDYQPWQGESYRDGRSAVIMQNVPTFQFRAVGSMIKLQVCVKSDLTRGAHAICKEKTVF